MGVIDVELTMTDESLQELAKQVAPLIKQPALIDEPEWMKLEPARQYLFCGKAPEWIRLYIFDRYPDTHWSLNNPTGFVINPRGGKGKTTQINVPLAKEWLHEHRDQIDWSERLEK